MDLELLYKKLLEVHGKLGKWWPGSPEEIVISAILTQNTNWKNVERAMENLKAKCTSLNGKDFLKCIYRLKSNLAELIKPVGFYNLKAQRLVNLLEWLKSYDFSMEEISKIELNKLRVQLLKINGVGEETADSIILYAIEKPVFVIDAYTKRLLSRLYNIKYRKYDEYKDLFESSISKATDVYQEYHGLIVDHSKKYCNSKPMCKECNLRDMCIYPVHNQV
ncbi:MAG: endonuclease [Fervidobacterium sp.]|nr:endonuclease [Fervidobacterium sp.]